MKHLNEIKNENDYYKGTFWIIGNSIKDIVLGKFYLSGYRSLANKDVNELNLNLSNSNVVCENKPCLFNENFE